MEMETKTILDEIANESSTNQKMVILGKYTENETLKRVLYLALSKRVKFYIKQIPSYEFDPNFEHITLDTALDNLDKLSNREHTGFLGIEWLQSILSSLTEDNAYIIERIISKDLKIGMGRSNINKVIPKHIEKINYLGATPFDDKKANNIFDKATVIETESNPETRAISEVKADGRYCNALIMGGELELMSRNGEETLLGGGLILVELAKFDDCVLNGELVIDGFDRQTSNGLMTSIIKNTTRLKSGDEKELKKAHKKIDEIKTLHGLEYDELLDRIRFITWDILEIDDFFNNKSKLKRIDRLRKLEDVLEKQNASMITLVEYKFVSTLEEALEHFAEMLERGEEGTVLKALDGIWKHGKPPTQIKMKIEFPLDLKIVGFNYGNKGTKNEDVISSINCESSCGILTAKAQGLTEEMMEHVTENQDKLRDTIMEIDCNGLSSNRNGGNSVLYPRYSKFRDDKTVANSYEECVAIENASKGLIEKIK